MKFPLRPLFVVSAILSLASCDKPTPNADGAPIAVESDNQLAEARDALQRQALEIETKTALMDKQLADMAQSLKERDNAELRSSLDALKRQNDELRVQAEAARQKSDAIAQRIAVAPPPTVVEQPVADADYSLFYERLAPYGRWFEVNGYGYCWRPTVTVAGWRPYVDGCWVWSSLGWAWQTNEPFGWATYHYGRWIDLARYGWVWVPGSDWAPAWVSWRQSRDCVGWAPLPPEQGVCNGVYRDCDSRYGLGPTSYTFINVNQFVSPTYIHVYAPVTQQTTIFQHSVNVTQMVPNRSRGHAFVNHGGPPRAQMEQACGQSLPQRQVQTMPAGQMPAQPSHHGRRDAGAPVAMVELPSIRPGARVMRPDVKEHIQRPARVSGFDGVPQKVATEIRETIAREKETAVVQQQRPQQQQPVRGRMPHQPGRRPGDAPTVGNGEARVTNAPPQESVGSPIVVEKPTAEQPQPGQGNRPRPFPRESGEAPVVTHMPAVPNAPAQESVRPAVAAETPAGTARETKHRGRPGSETAPTPNMPPERKVVEERTPEAAPAVPAVMPAVVENKGAEPAAAAVVPGSPVVPVTEPERTAPAVVPPQPAVMSPPAEAAVSQPPVAAEKKGAEQAGAEAERAQMRAAREQARAAAMEQRQQQGLQERGMAGKRAAEQAAANDEAEKSRMQAAAVQQEAQAAQQQRMAADQAAAAETEKARQQAAAAAAQQQQEMAAQQQRATAERMAAEQQATAAEAERAKQQAEAAAMQRQQEEVTRRAAEEQQMKAQQETAQRAQEMAQRQAEEQARRQQEAEMQRAQEQARQEQMRAQQEAAQRAQEMAQRQAEEQARRQQEAEMQRAQEQARQEQMRAQQEAAQRAQEMAQRQAEEQARRQQEAEMQRAQEQARRAQEEAQRAAAEAAQRAAAEAAARNQPQPAPPGS